MFAYRIDSVFYCICYCFLPIVCLDLAREKKTVFRLQEFWRDRRFYYGLSVSIVTILFSLLSYGGINGVRYRTPNSNVFKTFVPIAFKKLGYDVFADFQEKRVSEIPTNYGSIAKEDRLEFVTGADLKGRNIENADMLRAFLVKADLRGASLNNANLMYANLEQANLEKTNLQKANLGSANLKSANLKNANLSRANLREADLSVAELQEADFTGVKNLTIEQVSKAKTLYQTKLDPDLMEQLRKCCPHLLENPKVEIDKNDKSE